MTAAQQLELLDRMPAVLLVLAIALTAWQVVLVLIVLVHGGAKGRWPGGLATLAWIAWVLTR